MIFYFGGNGDWLDRDDRSTFHRTCSKCEGDIWYRRDGGYARPGSGDASRLLCPYCGMTNRVSVVIPGHGD